MKKFTNDFHFRFSLFLISILSFIFIFFINIMTPKAYGEIITIDYDWYLNYFRENGMIDNIKKIIDLDKKDNLNDFILFYNPSDDYFYFASFKTSNRLMIGYFYNQVNGTNEITTNITFEYGSIPLYHYRKISSSKMGGDISSTIEEKLLPSLSNRDNYTSSGSPFFRYGFKSSSYTSGNFITNVKDGLVPIIIYSSYDNLVYRDLRYSSINGVYFDVDIITNGEHTQYTDNSNFPTFYDLLEKEINSPTINYNLGAAYFDYTDYIYNQINWLSIKKDIMDSISLFDNTSNKLLINWVENEGIDVLIIQNDDNQKIDLKLYSSLGGLNYDNRGVLISASTLQGLQLENTNYLLKSFTFDTYIKGSISKWVSQFYDTDLTKYNLSNNYYKYTIKNILNSPYGFNNDNSKVYPIYFDENYFNLILTTDEDLYPYYYNTLDFVIDSESNVINNAISYNFKPIYNLYDFSSTVGAGSNSNLCKPGSECYFDNVISDNRVNGPIDQLLLFPLNIINKLIEMLNGTCNAIVLPLTHNVGNIELPCIRTLYENFGIQVYIENFAKIFNVIIIALYLINLWKWFDDLLSFDVDMDFLIE